MCNDRMPVSVKVYYGQTSSSAVEIRRFIFRPEQIKPGSGVFQALLDRIRALYNGLNIYDVHLCWKDDDGDYVVFSSDDELKVAINSTTDNTLRIYIRDKELPVRATTSNARPGRSNADHQHLRKPERTESSSRERDQRRCEPADLVVDGEVLSPGISTNHVNVPCTSSSAIDSVLCCECHGEGRGVWYKCTVCADFYLCSDCENRGLHDQHIMVRLSSSSFHGSQQNYHHR